MYNKDKYRLSLVGFLGLVGIGIPTLIFADIRFEDITETAGIKHSGQSYGASWGDLNGDGSPDIWVGNHNSKPSLYLNDGAGRFTNVIDKVWHGDPKADTHGSAWADFDNDGDQDLIELVGARENQDGTFCLGCGRNHLYVNENGVLVDKAKELGIDIPGLARSPQWFDADLDGLLDLLVANTRKPGMPSSIVFHQSKNGFINNNEEFGIRDKNWSRRDKLRGWIQNLVRLNFDSVSHIDMRKHLEFGLLAPLYDENRLDLVLFSSPTRVFSIDTIPFVDVTASIGFPGHKNVTGGVIEDFDGDGNADMYLTVGPYLLSDIVQMTGKKIKGTLTGVMDQEPKAIVFHSTGDLNIEFHPTWLSTKKIFIGAGGYHPESRTFSLSSKDPINFGPESANMADSGGVAITYNPKESTWAIRNTLSGEFLDFIIESETPIYDLQTHGFKPFKETGVDALYMRREGKFARQELQGDAGAHTACHFVTAGDFDNDMDIDLYLVCSGPVENLPNRILENDGNGNFRLVTSAGGAAGSALGRGDIAAIADYDRDGFLDIFLTNGWDPTSPFVADGPHQLFHNMGNKNHWIEIDLQGEESNRDGIGAKVTIEAGGVKQVRFQRGGMNRITQNHQRLHFGMGSNAIAKRITVNWPGGRTQVLENVQVDRILKIREGLELEPATAPAN